MAATGVTIRFRPVRVGLCVRNGNIEHLRRATRLSTLLWGGRFNPIIPVDDARFAKDLSRLFGVDTFFAVEADVVINAFVADHPHLAWPHLHSDFLIERSPEQGPRTALLDTRFAFEARARAVGHSTRN